MKSLLYSYFKNRFQGKQHLILLWNLRVNMLLSDAGLCEASL